MPLLLDTDVVIDYLRGVERAVRYVERTTERLLLSAVSVAEIFAGVREGRERMALQTFLEAFDVVPIDIQIAERGGLFRRDYGKSHNTGLTDALIAATAEAAGARLVTLNRKHFPMLSDVITAYRH